MSIREHGGAVRYWRHDKSGQRAVLCQDGKVLMLRGGRWKEPVWHPLAVAFDPVETLQKDTEWEEDTRSSMSAAITRTGREARRRE